MKNIVDSCFNPDIDEANNVKLRLRGKGSGFKEGQLIIESVEPLHLCISSKYYSKFQLACAYIDDLLESIYIEYKEHLNTYYGKYYQIPIIAKKVSVSNKNKRSKKR